MREILLLLFSIPAMLFGQNKEPEKEPVKIILGGDVMLGRSVMAVSLAKKDPIYPFRQIGSFLGSADLTLVNLENPVIQNCPTTNSGMIFCANPAMLEGLKYGGVDVVNLANNHTNNYGGGGLEETKKYLDQSEITYTGVGNLVVKEIKGTKFGFVGFEKSQQINPRLTKEESQLIANSNAQADVLIVSMHWGVEYKDIALPGVSALARELVDLGADVIVGHHPHWVQNIEKINGVPVYYSLGNLVFDQMWSEKTKEGVLVELTFDGSKIIGQRLGDTYIENIGQPRIRE